MSKMILAAVLVVIAALALPFTASANSGHGGEGHEASDGGGHEGQAAQPTDLAGAWAALTAARDDIAADVENGKLTDIHAKAEPLPMLVAALLAQSGELDGGKLKRVEGAAKQVPRVADALHDAADEGDVARTRKQLSRLDGLLELIRVQYPAGALEAGGAHAHGGQPAAPTHGQGAHAHMERPVGVVDSQARATIRIEAFDRLRFEPSRIEVEARVPTRIELANVGAAEHSLVVKTPDGARDWVHLHVPPGVTKAATYEFGEPGTYPVLCTIPGHTEGGMVGELVVLADHGGGGSHH